MVKCPMVLRTVYGAMVFSTVYDTMVSSTVYSAMVFLTVSHKFSLNGKSSECFILNTRNNETDHH